MEFWVVIGVLWLVSPLVLLIALIVARRQLKQMRQERYSDINGPSSELVSGIGSQFALVDLDRLLLLRLELNQQLKKQGLSEAEYVTLSTELDDLWRHHLQQSGLKAEGLAWCSERDQAWALLIQHRGKPGLPPWRSAPEEPIAVVPVSEPVLPPPLQIHDPRPLPPQPIVPKFQPSIAPSSTAISEAVEVSDSRPEDDEFAWEPAPPSPLEQLVQTLSGWSKLAAPFLVQNIGWFIGGFCFVAGTLFLVSYTSGFINALVIFASLLAYTGFLLWGGYQLRRRRPEQELSSTMLVIIGMLLTPLNIMAVTRLLIAAGASPLWLSVALLAATTTLAAFYWTANLVGGLMDRSLQGRHPGLLLILAGLQLLAPLLIAVQHWAWLAGLHGLLLVLVGAGLVVFMQDWVRSVFVERRRIAYYAGGMLVYSALVSFVHLTWVFPKTLPEGYYGPFLMALCGVLFYADGALKTWAKRYVFLSRFTFALYGLSVLAVVLCVQAPVPRLITLALGAGVYGLMVWRYLTLIPLYMSLACLGALYGLLILVRVPDAAYLLASLPGLAGLLVLLRWSRARSQAMARICFTVFGGSLAGLVGWSLFHAQPGWLGMGTALIASLAYALRLWLVGEIEDGTDSPVAAVMLRLGASLYPITILAAVTLAYAPRWLVLSWEMQFACGLLGLAGLWTWLGLIRSRHQAHTEDWINSALLSVLLAVFVALWASQADILRTPMLGGVMAVAGGMFLWLAMGLRLRGLCYVALLCWGLTGMIIKRSYFPMPSSGLMAMLLVLLLWGLIRWMDRLPKDLAKLSKEAAMERSRLTVLWWFSAFRARFGA